MNVASLTTDPEKSELQVALECASLDFYPNISKVFRVLPVCTATAERSFSCLRRLKTWLRSTMTESQLTGLAMMHLHKDINVDQTLVLSEWTRQKGRRILTSNLMWTTS